MLVQNVLFILDNLRILKVFPRGVMLVPFESVTLYFCSNRTTIVFLQVSKLFLPSLAVGYEDPRVRLHIGDGM